jgi:hypothetical protein
MITTLMNVLSDLSVDEPIAWGRVRVFPLRLQRMTNLEYLTLDDSASPTLITVEETSTSGSVPELRVRNRTKSRVLIPEGSTLIGAKQNRVVNLSVVIAPESVTVIPVSCVERGRWRFRTPHFAAGGFAGSPLRAQMCRDVTENLHRTGKVQVNQGAVWSHVDGMLKGAGVRSPTAAYHALYEKWQPEFADYEARLRLPENACGVAVEIDGLLEAVDLFDKPSTLHKLWPRLVRSYVLAALGPRVPQGKKTDVKALLERMLSSGGESYEPVGVGTTIRLAHAEAAGAALMCEGQLVHLSVFANGVPNPSSSREPLPTPQASEPADQPKPSSPHNPWWRFWT